MGSMSLLADATAFIETASHTLPLLPFLFWASLLEELIAPIPAFFVAIVAAPLVHAQHYTVIGIIGLALLSGAGKTLGTWIYYILGDKAESWVTGKWGRALGLSHQNFLRWGAKLGKGWKDEIFLTIVRMVPIFPSAPISVLAGVLKIRMRSFFGATFVGFSIRNGILLAVAYEGFDWWKAWLKAAEDAGLSFTSILVIGTAIGLCWFLWKGHHQALAKKLMRLFRARREGVS